jgi:DNA-binding beta-propeller fold protein YncE
MIHIEQSISPLQLSYILSSEPNPIRVSAGEDNPQVIDLQIYISNPLLDSVEIEEIKIEIPMGANNARTLSAAPSLPKADPGDCLPWSINVDGGKITIAAKDGKPREFGREVVIFKLKQIRVNSTPGTVPITITEYYGSDKETDTAQLIKLESDFPVTSFSADPEVLTNYGNVKFFWRCSDQGPKYKYSVYPQGTTPVDCRDGRGECKAWDAGIAGVQSGRLEKTTTFNLDVLKAESEGRYSVYKTLTRTVRVEMPFFHQDYGWVQSVSGRLLQLGWIAENAGKCAVEFNNNVIDDNAPTNTGSQNYVVLIADNPGTYPVKLTALSRDGKRKASLSLDNAKITGHVTVDVGHILGKVEVTPDGKVGLLIDSFNDKVVAIDIPNKKVLSTTTLSTRSVFLSITPDGKYALIGGVGIKVMDTGTLKLRPEVINTGKYEFGAVFTPDSKLAFVDHKIDRAISVIDMTTFKVTRTFPFGGDRYTWAFNITPDGKYILMMLAADETGATYFRVIDTNKLEFVGEPVHIGLCTAIFSTADSKYAIATDFLNRCIRVIDIASRTVVKTIDPGFLGPPLTIAPIPGTKFMLAGGAESNKVSLINMDTFVVKNTTLPTGEAPYVISVTADGTALLINSLFDGLKFF